MIVTRMFGDNPESQQDMGVRQQVPPSSVNAIPVVYGDASMGGTFVDAVLTTDQKTMYYVLAISSISSANAALGTSAGVFNFDRTKMYYGDRLITFDGTDLTKVVSLTDEAGNVDTKISGNLYINLYKSSSAGVITSANAANLPSVVMGGSDIDVAQRWTGTRQMNNLAFAIVKLVYNRDADTTQLNPITFNVSHYPNGASVAKPGDVWLDYITNQDYGGAVGWLPDGSFSAAFVDTTCVAPLNTYSDATITYTPSGGGSATQARYRINGVLDAGQSVLSNLDRIMSACDSWMTYNAALGQWSVVINKAETTAYAFTDNNIVGDIRVSATDITSSINQVEARFPFKSNRDQAAFVNLETPYALLYPNEPVNKYSITYDLVNDSVQASYLANRLLEQAREDLIVSFSTTYYGIQVDAGTVVSVTNADYGWNAKLFRVMKVNEASLPDGSLGAKLELNEYNAQVYDDATIQQFTPAPNSGLPSASYFSALAAPTVTGFPSATIPYINVQVFVPTTGRVTFGSLFWTTSATPVATDWKLVTTVVTTNNQPVANGTYYTFANITLNTGTYYFAYNVGNDITTSILSPISSSLTWNPINGLKTAEAIVYQWSATAPAISGSSTYTWTNGAVTSPPTNWDTTVSDTATDTLTLWSAEVTVSATSNATTSTINWSSSSIVPFGYVGTTGASARIAYTATTTTLNTTPNSYTISGDNVPVTGTWGTGIVWSTVIPTLALGQAVWQTEGIYNPTNNQTIWGVPYLNSLKVGNLSALSTNTGNLTVTGTFQANTAAISGTTMTGSGGVLYPTGYFAFGDSTSNITYNGTAININGLANASSSSFTGSTDITSNTSTPYSLLTFTKKNATTGLISISGSFQLNTSYIGADSMVLNLVLTLRGNNGWSINPSTQRIQSVLGPTASTAKQGGAPLTFVFMFNTNDWGSGATGATSITAGLIYSAGLYDSAGTLLTSSSADWTLTMLGSNNSFYQPLLGS